METEQRNGAMLSGAVKPEYVEQAVSSVLLTYNRTSCCFYPFIYVPESQKKEEADG